MRKRNRQRKRASVVEQVGKDVTASAPLTQKQIRGIQDAIKEGKRRENLADRFGISYGAIRFIELVGMRPHKPKQIALEPPPPVIEPVKVTQVVQDRRGERNGRAKLTDADIHTIRALKATGRFTQKKIAEEFGVGQKTISFIVRGKSWTHI